ncbi:MAG: YceD family protein [Bacteroidia bacterium]
MAKNQYIVKFAGLPVGTHEFEFDIKDKFFEQFTDSEIRRADIHVDLILLKQNNLMQMDFKIKGTVELDCDRCTKSYDFPVEAADHLVVKFGNPDESTDEILVISEGEGQADVSQYLYEYISLALPFRRVPCEIDERFECDYETLNKLNENLAGEEDETTNPLWEQLNKLKKYNKN